MSVDIFIVQSTAPETIQIVRAYTKDSFLTFISTVARPFVLKTVPAFGRIVFAMGVALAPGTKTSINTIK